jgi:AraC family transcriptional regulator, arabinose operon regulatory protein
VEVEIGSMAINLNNSAVNQVLICDRFARGDHYHEVRTQGTRDWLLFHTVSGEGVFRLHGETFRIGCGDVAILHPGTPHDYAAATGSVWIFDWAHCLLSSRSAADLRRSEPIPGLSLIHLDEIYLRERIGGAFQRMIADSRGSGPYAQELSSHALTEILLLLASKTNSSEGRQLDSRVTETLHRMGERLADEFTVEDFARHVGLSPSRFSHLFKEQTGLSVMEAFTQLRLRQAAKLLEFTDLRVQEIALDVGFHSPYYFTERFTAFYRVSPRSYRKNAAAKRNESQPPTFTSK